MGIKKYCKVHMHFVFIFTFFHTRENLSHPEIIFHKGQKNSLFVKNLIRSLIYFIEDIESRIVLAIKPVGNTLVWSQVNKANGFSVLHNS